MIQILIGNSLRDKNSEFKTVGMQCFGNSASEMFKLAFTSAFQDFSRKIGCRFTTVQTEQFFFKVIRETMEYRKKHNVHRNDFMELMIELMQKGKIADDDDANDDSDDDSLLTFNEIAAQCFIFFLGGYETSSITISYCLYELAKNQEIQDRLRSHINEVLTRHGNNMTYDALMDMPYLDQVIHETLRLYPPVSLLQRKLVRPYKLPDTSCVLKPGYVCFVSVYGLQRDERYFDNPNVFDPERFSPENASKIVPYSFVPFGEGPRKCIGLRFGMMQTRLGLVSILRNFKVDKCLKTVKDIKFAATSPMLLPSHGIWLNVSKL